MAEVEIDQTSMGGSILYREDGNVIRFGWEFAASPTLVLVFGSPTQGWDERFPRARGRQTEIYDVVSAGILRQQAPGSTCKIDLEDGTIAVMQA